MTMTDTTPAPMATPAPAPQTLAVKLTIALSATVFLLMMLFGLLMRMAQGEWIAITPELFYQIMTAHGIGMVGTAGVSGAAIMWYFLGKHVKLTPWVFWFMIGMFLAGVVFILGSIFLGGFGGAWTFLFPLPAKSGGVWPAGAAAAYLVGVILVGVGFLVYYLEAGRAVISRYGGLANALALPLLFKGAQEDVPPPAVVASAAVTIFNGIGIVFGAAVLIISLINVLFPSFAINPLLAKNMIYFFGHVFINAAIYMAVIAVYEIMPEYTGQPWPTTRVFAGAWAAILLMVMAVYPHHLLQDTVMPAWALVIGQIISYASGIPLIAVTAFGLLMSLRKSSVAWDLASALLVLSVFGWSAGAIPAIIDAMVAVNKVMHNTMWVPGHFHMYLILGEVAMVFGFMVWLTRKEETLAGTSLGAFVAYAVGGFGFAAVLLIAGAQSVPRRWAAHMPEWLWQDHLSALFALLVVLGTAFFLIRYVARFAASPKE
jgi:cytochrome c oxidase subunit 1